MPDDACYHVYLPMMSNPTRRGYTLLEMTVSVGLFSLVMLLATGAFLKFISLDRKARYTNDVVNNLNFAIDSMTRSIRTGSNYRCGGEGQGPNCWPPTSGQSTFSFVDDRGRTVTYLRRTDGSIGRCALTTGSCSPSTAIAVTDSRINIQNMTFYVRGVGTTTSPDNVTQPSVVMSIRGQMTPGPNQAPIDFAIETMATQRLIEL